MSKRVLTYKAKERQPKLDPDHKLFGDVLRTKRLELGLTQLSVARQINRDQSYISRYENGNFRKIPTLTDIKVWCSVIELNPVELLYECHLFNRGNVMEFSNYVAYYYGKHKVS